MARLGGGWFGEKECCDCLVMSAWVGEGSQTEERGDGQWLTLQRFGTALSLTQVLYCNSGCWLPLHFPKA